MAQVKIPELPAATSVGGSDVLPIVQSGTTKKATYSLLKQILGLSFSQVETDSTTSTPATWEDLITIAFTKSNASSVLVVSFSASSSNSANSTQNTFRLLVDGTQRRAVSARGQSIPQTCAFSHVLTGLAAGAHTLKAQWRADSGTARIRPETHSDDESSSLLVEEVLL